MILKLQGNKGVREGDGVKGRRLLEGGDINVRGEYNN